MSPKPWCHSCEGNDTGTRSPGHRCAGEPLCLKDPSVPLQACPPVRGMGDFVHRTITLYRASSDDGSQNRLRCRSHHITSVCRT